MRYPALWDARFINGAAGLKALRNAQKNFERHRGPGKQGGLESPARKRGTRGRVDDGLETLQNRQIAHPTILADDSVQNDRGVGGVLGPRSGNA